jgi:hybrid cluster-associated redox disulfide protein
MNDLHSQLTVESLLRRFPDAARVFLGRGMACPGCAMAPFESLAEVTAVYRVELGRFLEEIEGAVGAAPDRGGGQRTGGV